MKEIEARLTPDTLENTYAVVLKQEQWLIQSRLFLPGKFPSKWFGIRNKLQKAIRREKKLESETGTDKDQSELEQLEAELKNLVDEAILEIYKVTKLSCIKPWFFDSLYYIRYFSSKD